MQSEAEKTRRQRTKTCTWRRPIYCTNPATKSRARSLARSQSCRIPTRNSARSVSRPAKTIHASRRYLQKKQPRRRKPVPSRRLVPLTKSGTGFSVHPLARRGVCPAKLGRALLARLTAICTLRRGAHERNAHKFRSNFGPIQEGDCATFSAGLLHRTISCHDLSVGKQVLSSRGLCVHPLQAIVLSRGYGAAFQYPAFDGQSTPVQLAVSDRETGKRTHSLHRLRTAWFLVPSSEPNLRKPRNLSQRRRWMAHNRAFGSGPNGFFEDAP